MTLEPLLTQAMHYDVIGIDEGQFVSPSPSTSSSNIIQFPDIVNFCEVMANAGKLVIVASLDGTFQRKSFGEVLTLVPMAESIQKLSAVCSGCFKDAHFTRRMTSETEVEVGTMLRLVILMCSGHRRSRVLCVRL